MGTAAERWECCRSGCLQDFYRLRPPGINFERLPRACWEYVWHTTRQNYVGLFKLTMKLRVDIMQLAPFIRRGDKGEVKWRVEQALKVREKLGKAIEADYKGCARCGAFRCSHRVLINPYCACVSPQLCRCWWGVIKDMDTTTWVDDATVRECSTKSRSGQREMVKQMFLELSNAMGLLWIWTRNNKCLAGIHEKICAMRQVVPSCEDGGEMVLYYAFKPFSRKSYVGISEVSFYDRVYQHYRKALNNCVEGDTKITREMKEHGPSAFIFIRLLSTTRAKIDGVQLQRLETVAIDWLRPTKNTQKVNPAHTDGERWGIAAQLRVGAENKSGPLCWRKVGRISRDGMRVRNEVANVRSHFLKQMMQIILKEDDGLMNLVEDLTAVPPTELVRRKVKLMPETRFWRLRSLGMRIHQGGDNKEEQRAFLRNIDRARNARKATEETRTNIATHYPYLSNREKAALRAVLRQHCPAFATQPCYKLAKFVFRRAKGKNFKDMFSNVRRICRHERVDKDAACYCSEAPEEWKIHGHVCTRASRILPLPPGWNANSRFHPTREEAEKRVDTEVDKAVKRLGEVFLITDPNGLRMGMRDILKRSSETAAKGYANAERGRPQPKDATAADWLRRRLVVGELDKQSQECFAVCRYWYKNRMREYLTENQMERVRCLKSFGRRDGMERFFDRKWEKRDGWRLKSEQDHRFGRLFLLVKKKQLVKKPEKLAIRPVVSFSRHRYRRHYALAGRAVEAMSRELFQGWETTTVAQMIARIDNFNGYNAVHNRPAKAIYRDVENMFGSIPPHSALEVLRQGAERLRAIGRCWIWVPKERVSSSVNRNLSELINVRPINGVARTLKNKRTAEVANNRPRGRKARMMDAIELREVLEIVRHGIRWNVVYVGRRVFFAPVLPMGNPYSPNVCTFWTAAKEWVWFSAKLSNEAREAFGKSWTRIRGVDDVMVVINSLFHNLPRVQRANILRPIHQDFYGEGVLLLDGDEGTHFGMSVRINDRGGVELRKRRVEVEEGAAGKLTNGRSFGCRQRTQAVGHILRVIDFSDTLGRAAGLINDADEATRELQRADYRAEEINRAIRSGWSRLNFVEKRKFRGMLSLQV